MAVTRTVGAYEAKTRLSALLELVEEGHEVVITRHERPVAKLVPMSVAVPKAEVFRRIGGLRGRMTLPKGETVKDLIDAGRRL